MNSSIHSEITPVTLPRWVHLVAPWLLLLCLGAALQAQSRIKDVSTVIGARENQLTGIGLVVGLDGKGDSDPLMTQQVVANLARSFGINLRATDIKAKNAAVVMVTAKVPPFSRNGAKLDVSVSSMADAKSLQGGMLLQTPLVGGDGQVYAVAQGSVAIGGMVAGTGGSSFQKNHPTVGQIAGGALVEREIATDVFANGMLEVNLREPDFTSAVRMANAINETLGPIAQASSSSTVQVFVPNEMQNDQRLMEFVARVENVIFRPDAPARIVINEKTGTIVANAKIRIDACAVAHGNLTVSIVRDTAVSQPNAFTGNVGDIRAGAGGAGGTAAPGVAGAAQQPLLLGANAVFENDEGEQVQVPIGQEAPDGYRLKMIPSTSQAGVAAPGAPGGNVNVAPGAQTVVTTNDTVKVDEPKKSLVVLDDMPTVEEVATALNSLGVTPRDMMSIFQTMKQAGALQAELVMQ
jgi:flagellar P-ring protein precursor FlgI